MSDKFQRGDIVLYPYLWRWQNNINPHRDHGEKDRPVCMILAIKDKQGLTHILLLPISSKPPSDDQKAIEIPGLELRRANLTRYKRGWITVSECNYDVIEKSYHFDARRETIGRFSEAFLEEIRLAFAPFLATGSAKVSRT
ncbi:hypothetical protein DSM25558_0360 [Agrobacterium sp. DSM 25558]|uniref:PemK-like protein n=2 Tax=Agrobacterium rosae TaxID=1972867 RepID=A0AAW9FBX7_9HYPH|nr:MULTISPECIES: hypothetical protein [Agrobacterium]MDX8301087.1 hypothetical protein [Agrobacterium rosae]POO57562.1 hypothetical protein CTT39_02485 [Agrobacterium rosae]SCX01985.1 hypothetical protein DSM25558_0360 [Agrobacterium sp. DSM 25558]